MTKKNLLTALKKRGVAPDRLGDFTESIQDAIEASGGRINLDDLASGSILTTYYSNKLQRAVVLEWDLKNMAETLADVASDIMILEVQARAIEAEIE